MTALSVPATATGWSFDDLPSRIEDSPHRTAMRTDPYYDETIPTGSSDGWVSDHQYRRATEKEQRWSGIPKSFVIDRRDADRALRTDSHRASILTTLGAVASWRTLTREQLGAIAGSSPLAGVYPAALSPAFSAGMLAHGYASGGVNRLAPRAERMSMWSVGDDRKAFERYARTLTCAERLSVTGGATWNAEHRFDRHNVLSTELALRAAEFCDIATVLGEKQVNLPAILRASGITPGPSQTQRKADIGIVRPDGLTVLIETTASAGPTFKKKMRKWAETLLRHPSRELPVVVLVVDVSTASQALTTDSESSARSEIIDAVREAVTSFPGTSRNRVAERIGVASWTSWFPERGRVSDDFLDLSATFHTGDDPTNRWQTRRVLDTEDIEFSHGSEERADVITRNSRLLAGTPYWLRIGPRPDLSSWLLQAARLDKLDGIEKPSVPDRMLGAGFTVSVGGRKWTGLTR